MMMIESATAVRFPAAANFFYSSALHRSGTTCSSTEVTSCHVTSRRLFCGGSFNVTWNGFRRLNSASLSRRIKNNIRATAEHLGSASDPAKQNGSPHYHPFEEMGESMSKNSADATLTAAETSRTIIEVNSKATVMFSGMINGEVHENIMWPDLPYATDEDGNVYLHVKNDEDILRSLTVENNFVQVLIGFDTTEIMKEIELSGPLEVDFGIEEIDDEDFDIEDEDEDDDDDGDDDEDYDEEWIAAFEDEADQDDSDGTFGDWAKLETMRSSHPMYFAKTLTEVASDDPIDWMEQPSDGLAIQGLLRPAFTDEHSEIQKHISTNQSCSCDTSLAEKFEGDKLEELGIINGHGNESELSGDSSTSEESEKNEISSNRSSFYKLEMIKIQLITAHGHQTDVELEDFKQAQPDAIAHSAAKIISRLKADGEKTTQALKSLCLRCKGIQVEEVAIISVDSLGFVLRACCGTQIETLRFTFNDRATSEYSAERQINDLLFPRSHQRPQKQKTGSSK
ncbi:hypothetical protein like AT5G24060 [Hibiscus trionum]|uniref:Pentatricopeptide repeat superfamily protein n=1 Tax=Hibiscus trionum TaxID=183268 RepID=A0A9W7HGU5_HIBTR|nr:hypothetical protein like AT5G24060 [Hibiscus trionum]